MVCCVFLREYVHKNEILTHTHTYINTHTHTHTEREREKEREPTRTDVYVFTPKKSIFPV